MHWMCGRSSLLCCLPCLLTVVWCQDADRKEEDLWLEDKDRLRLSVIPHHVMDAQRNSQLAIADAQRICVVSLDTKHGKLSAGKSRRNGKNT